MTSLPGGIGVSHLRVYEGGGTPHLHTVCAEAYLVVGGRGAVQTVTLAEGFRETPLEAGALVSFPPGTIHRLVNERELEIYVLMSNAGLPEAGDLVITFEPPVLADLARYAEAATLPEQTMDAATRRRERALAGFARIRAGGEDSLRAFHAAAARVVESRVPDWRARVVPDRTEELLEALEAGSTAHFTDAAVTAVDQVPRYGCCGLLGAYVV
ncbi:MAG TPA: cupin domain-containing protein [Acidimicrobiales bacterium]|nr:cupin domain-containing protein [Acidimicrobiales bacterium]